MSKTVKERLYGAITVLLTAALSFLITNYFSGFALKADVEKIDIKYESKLDKVLTGLCIIDQRTCELKRE